MRFICIAAKTLYLTTDASNASEIIGGFNSGKLLPNITGKNDYCIAKINECAPLFI